MVHSPTFAEAGLGLPATAVRASTARAIGHLDSDFSTLVSPLSPPYNPFKISKFSVLLGEDVLAHASAAERL